MPLVMDEAFVVPLNWFTVDGDTFSTGGTLVYFTPGVVVPLTPAFAIHSDVQIPVYQNLNGIQLAPTYIFSVGARYSF